MNQIMNDQHTSQPQSRKEGYIKFLVKRIAVFFLVLLVIGGSVYLFIYYKNKDNKTVASDPNASAYSAIFLTNGQVYFGKLGEIHDNFLTLSDIYYIQSGATPAQDGKGVSPEKAIPLIKLGNEIHGPTDKMYINTSNILFYESLRTDSRMVQSIESYIGKSIK